MNQKGFAPLIIIVIVTLAIGVGVGGFFVFQEFQEKKMPSFEKTARQVENAKPKPSSKPKTQLELKPKSVPPRAVPITTLPTTPAPQSLSNACRGKGTVNFTSPPMRLKDIGYVLPLGLMTGDHVTPTSHGYYMPVNWNPGIDDWNPDTYVDILAPADGVITDIRPSGSGERINYHITIHHTCTFYTVFILVKQLSPRILELTENAQKRANVSVVAGEVIGRGRSFDFGVYNTEAPPKNFVVPEHYSIDQGGGAAKLQIVDIFSYFLDPIKNQLLEKNIRTIEPRSGRVDYDIDGRLVGNWFLENSEGYKGGPGDYWKTHLTFAYDFLDPSFVIISMGDFNGRPQQFAIKGNTPDPASISIASGIVKYELISFGHVTEGGQTWNGISPEKISKAFGYEHVGGVVIVKMIGDRKIKFEAFPDKTASEINGFTSAARIYER